EVETFCRQAGRASDLVDLLSIASTNHLHHGRWNAARETTAEQLNAAALTQDPVLISEAILMASVVQDHDGAHDNARRSAVVAGSAFSSWAGPVWTAF